MDAGQRREGQVPETRDVAVVVVVVAATEEDSGESKLKGERNGRERKRRD